MSCSEGDGQLTRDIPFFGDDTTATSDNKGDDTTGISDTSQYPVNLFNNYLPMALGKEY